MELLAEHGMTTLRVALAQINATVGDLDGNVRKVVDYVGRARDLGADVVALPELAITGYPPEDLVFRPQFVAANRQALDDVIAESHGITVIVGFVDSEPNSGPNPGQGRIYNAAAVASDGELVSVYRKQLLPNYGVFDERRYFTPGDSTQVYGIGGSPMAVNICEDIWFSHGPTGAQAIQGARLIVNINGSPYHRGKRVQREGMLAERARENGVAIAYVNMVGGQDELVFDGGSVFVSPTGDVTTRARQFEEELLVCDVPIAQMAPNPDSDLGTGTGTGTTEGFIAISGARPKPRPSLPATQDPDPMSDLEEVYTALVTGTGDYVRKTGFDKVVLALSGGIDSTLVTVIATDALGPENVVVVSMPSRYSSQGSVTDADALARNLGVEMLSTPIEPVFAAYLSTLESAFAGTEPDVAEENLQSRIRGDLVMALSNKFGYLALTTGNKSEYATGYATLYGDMSGGFAVIKDVPKTLVYDLCRYRNTVSPVIPVSVIIKPPSAELRPDQLDEDSLPPYEVLDPIAKAYVEDDLSYGQIVELGYAPETVQRVISLIDRAEYKRRQAAPGVKITERNFGRDRRMPIINRYRPF